MEDKLNLELALLIIKGALVKIADSDYSAHMGAVTEQKWQGFQYRGQKMSEKKVENMKKDKQNTDIQKDNFKWILSEYGGNVYIADMDTYELLYLNQTSCNTLQSSYHQLVGRKCYEVIQGRNSPCPFCTNGRLKKDETYEWEFYNPVLKRTFIIKNRMLDWEGHRARLELSYDMYSAEYKLAKKDQEREAILKTIPAGMVRIDARDCSTVLWCNDRFLDMIGYTKVQFEEELHNQCSYLQPDDLERAMALIKGMKQSGETAVFEAKAYTRANEERIWTVTLCYMSGDDSWDGIPSYYSVGLDITDERKQIETLQHKAETDQLTGICNRSEAERQIQKYLHENRDSMGVLMIIDVDNFKQVNDTRGHMAGDIVLCEIASGMKKLMRRNDVVGRIGGDEFVIFMKYITSLDAAQNKARELLSMLNHLFETEKNMVNVTCSIGIAAYPEDGKTLKELLKNADRALYQSKIRGKNCYAFYQDHEWKDLEENTYFSTGTAIDSGLKYNENTNQLTHYIFKCLYEEENTDQAINHVLEMVGRQLDVSRAYIFENMEDGHTCSNTYEWCKEGISPQIENLQNLNYQEFGNYDELFDDTLIFYCRDIHTLNAEQKQLFADQGIHATLQCGFKNGEALGGFVGFDECTGKRLWTQTEVDTLILISQLISLFLKQKRGDELKQKNNRYKALLENLNLPVWVAEAETGILLYTNRKFKDIVPDACIGCPFNWELESSRTDIQWNGKNAYLYQG